MTPGDQPSSAAPSTGSPGIFVLIDTLLTDVTTGDGHLWPADHIAAPSPEGRYRAWLSSPYRRKNWLKRRRCSPASWATWTRTTRRSASYEPYIGNAARRSTQLRTKRTTCELTVS